MKTLKLYFSDVYRFFTFLKHNGTNIHTNADCFKILRTHSFRDNISHVINAGLI
jgi:hypothetical protein